jgi:hypothetical protein
VGKVTFVDVAFAGQKLRAKLLEDRAPSAVAAFRAALPLAGRAFQDQYSSQVMRISAELPADPAPGDRVYGYQYPGLVMLDPTTRQLAICFGRGRLQNSLGAIGVVPLAEIGGGLTELARVADRLQFEGAKPIDIRLSDDQTSSLAEPPVRGRAIALTLAGARATAVLLEDVSPKATAAFAAVLPLEGKATNTYGSGPLTRFWNPAGGSEGETPLEVPENEVNQATLYGGGYYLSTKPWRGIRISAQEPTAMGGGRMMLAPLFRFTGDWSAFRAKAATLTLEGQKDLRIELT